MQAERLVRLGLVSRVGGQLRALDPQLAVHGLLSAHRATLERALREMDQMPALAALSEHYAPTRCYGGPASELIQSRAGMNAEIGAALSDTTSELLTVQPGRPESRDPAVYREGIARARRLLERGVAVRSLYSSAALEHGPTREYCDLLIEGGAEVRVAYDLPPRMVLTGNHLFVDNIAAQPADPDSGWHVTDIAGVSFARAVYELYWARATPWQTAAAALSQAVTTRQQRAVLRGLAEGRTQGAVGVQLEISEREVRRELTSVRKKLGLKSTYALLYWWATSPDHGIP
ncbi:LuxR C-terminal-related transcriptional regulator [Streptomyces sp. NPDC057854]|uniref:LuxR C-terminal-related transcriptional regulator n=1 Tax=unclassified Streptomyces TaxID=2593676 RepID=UPI0036AAFC44